MGEGGNRAAKKKAAEKAEKVEKSEKASEEKNPWTARQKEILEKENIHIKRQELIDLYSDLGFKGEDFDITVSTSAKGGFAEIRISAQRENLQLARKIYISKDKKSVWHSALYLPQEKQKKGIGKELFRKQIKLYDRLGIEKIGTNTDRVGNYAWAKYGFNADQRELNKFWKQIRKYVPSVKKETPSHMSEIASFKIKNVADLKMSPKDTKAITTGSKYKDKNGNLMVGKYILMKSDGWSGELDLSKGSQDRKILESYLDTK